MKVRQFYPFIVKQIKKLSSFFKLSNEEKEIYLREIVPDNTRRAFYLSLMAIPLSIIHFLLFISKLNNVNGIEYIWVQSIMYTHLSLLFIAIISAIVLYFSYFRNKKTTPLSNIYTFILIFLVLMLGVVLTTFDQYVTPAITPFLNTTLLIALFFQIRPIISTLFYSFSFIIFYFAVSRAQINEEMMMSNVVNGISVSLISLILSFILWRSKLTRIIQRDQIVKQNLSLFENNAQKDKFFSIIAHDLINPFNSIIGFSGLLLDQVKEKNYSSVEHFASIIHKSANSNMDLLRNLMEWSRAHTGKMVYKPEQLELNEIVTEIEQLFNAALLQKKIDLSTKIPEKTMVFADRNMIQTIIRNLISNAIKFTNNEGNIMLSVQKIQQDYIISVKDNGVGIPPESLDGLFKIDQNNSTKGTQNESGTGLGLILCKELVEKHNGKIWVESELGKGTTFIFSIPALA
jgi:signal transduction histidine kinase